MPRYRHDLVDLQALLAGHENVVTRRLLLEAGVSDATIARRSSRHGPWQRLLPGVYLAHRGTPTPRERTLAAVAYGGPAAVITGATALRLRGVQQVRDDGQIRILVPHDQRRQSRGFVVIERTRRPPDFAPVQGLPTASLARAVIDQSRHLARLDDVRALIAAVVQQRRVSPAQIGTELREAARAGTALPRLVFAEIDGGIRSVAEARARQVLAERHLPSPLWNVDLFTADGEFLCNADALWEDVGAVLELDSMAWHLDPASYKRTQRRQRVMTNHGLLVLPYAPGDLLAEPDRFADDVADLLLQASRRPAPHGLIVVRDGVSRARRAS